MSTWQAAKMLMLMIPNMMMGIYTKEKITWRIEIVNPIVYPWWIVMDTQWNNCGWMRRNMDIYMTRKQTNRQMREMLWYNMREKVRTKVREKLLKETREGSEKKCGPHDACTHMMRYMRREIWHDAEVEPGRAGNAKAFKENAKKSFRCSSKQAVSGSHHHPGWRGGGGCYSAFPWDEAQGILSCPSAWGVAWGAAWGLGPDPFPIVTIL